MNNLENLSNDDINYLISRMMPRIKIVDNTRYFMLLFTIIMIIMLLIIIFINLNYKRIKSNIDSIHKCYGKIELLDEDFTNLNRLVTVTGGSKKNDDKNVQFIQKGNIELFSNSEEMNLLTNSLNGI
jgi:hypothetical protein